MDQPAWLNAAWGELGVAERPGGGDNPRVVAYYSEAGHGEIRHDEVAWCAAFAGAMLRRAGAEGTKSLLARSYLSWGEALSEVRLGAIAVLERGEPWAGHVGFVVGTTPGKVYLLGGNQGDAVTVAAFDSSRVLAYRWPASGAAQSPPGLPSSNVSTTTSTIFQQALKHVLEMEGGFSDDPYDPGGPTNRGITLSEFARSKGVTIDATSRARLVEELKRIPDDAVRDIYRAHYWNPGQCEALPAALALMHFDAAVNHGLTGAARMLQQAAGTGIDGAIGAATLSAVARANVGMVIEDYAAIRRARYRALPHFWRFGRGWLSRVDKTEARAKALLNTTTTTNDISKGASAMEPIQYPDATMAQEGKWWAESKTIWGALITAAATVLPVLGPLIGFDLPIEVLRQAGEQSIATVQALVGLVGTLLTIYGRLKATAPLTRRAVSLKL